MPRWIQKNGELIPIEEYRPKSRLHVIGDIEPYVAVTGDAKGEWIKSRKEHREFLRRNDLVEVGNEKGYMTRYQGKSPDNPNLISDRKHEDRICRSLIRNLERLKTR